MGCMLCMNPKCNYGGNENPCPFCGMPCEYDEHRELDAELLGIEFDEGPLLEVQSEDDDVFGDEEKEWKDDE